MSLHIIKKVLNQIGFDIIKASKSPRHSLLGLSNLPIKTIIDVGANRGQFAKYIKPLFPEARLYCFEPLPEPFKELKQWAEKYRNEKVTAFNLALGDNEGILEMYSHVEHNPSSSFLKTSKICESIYPFIKKQVSIPVKMMTLNKWTRSLPTPFDLEILIKLDVQGYEDRVIQGGREIFSIAKACIIEVNMDHLYKQQATFKDISLLLYNLNFHYVGNLSQTYADDGHVIYINAIFSK